MYFLKIFLRIGFCKFSILTEDTTEAAIDCFTLVISLLMSELYVDVLKTLITKQKIDK